MASDGMSYSAIGSILGRDKKTVRSAVLGLGGYFVSQETP